MRLTSLVEYLSTNYWAIEPTFLARGQRLLREAVAGRLLTGAEIHAETGMPMPSEDEQEARATKAKDVRIAIVPIVGTIMEHGQSMGTSARRIDGMLTGAMQSRNVDAIMLDVQSPGGVVTGIPELAAKIATARQLKPMLTFNGGMMASAAYWLGAATGEVMATASALTGSIGVFTWHEDWSKHLEQEGIRITEIGAGEFKTEGAPWKALTEEALAHEQGQVDHFYALFVKDVATFRGDTQTAVREGYGRGRVETVPVALKANLIDRMGTFEDALARLVAKAQAADRKGRRTASLVRELEMEG